MANQNFLHCIFVSYTNTHMQFSPHPWRREKQMQQRAAAAKPLTASEVLAEVFEEAYMQALWESRVSLDDELRLAVRSFLVQEVLGELERIDILRAFPENLPAVRQIAEVEFHHRFAGAVASVQTGDLPVPRLSQEVSPPETPFASETEFPYSPPTILGDALPS